MTYIRLVHFFFLFFHLISFTLKADSSLAGGDYVGNALFDNIRYAYANIETFIEACLMSQECQITHEEQNLLNEVLKAMPQERKNLHPIEFLRKSDRFFQRDQTIYLSLTENQIGKTIFFNMDRLLPNSQNNWRRVGVETIVTLLVRELGYHHRILDLAKLKDLGFKVQSFLRKHTQSMSVSADLSYIQAHLRNLGTPLGDDHSSELLIADTESLHRISQTAPLPWKCPSYSFPLGPPIYKNPRWYTPTWSNKEDRSLHFLNAVVEMHCANKFDPHALFTLSFVIEVMVPLTQSRSTSMRFIDSTQKIQVQYFQCNRFNDGHPYCKNSMRR